MIERPIQFYFRGSLRQIAGPSPTRTVLQYLREDLRQTGSRKAAPRAIAAPAPWRWASWTPTAACACAP